MSKSTLDSSVVETSPKRKEEPALEYCVLYRQEPLSCSETHIDKLEKQLPVHKNPE